MPPPAEAVAVVSEPIAVTVPEAVFAARVPAPEPPRPLPHVRRGIFFDVENSSRPEHVAAVLDHLEIDWITHGTDLVAIGNWRVVSNETARLLARRGAQLVHSAPSVGIRDWTDLRIAVAAGAWLAAARPGDRVEIISDDQAFDAVGDVAATLGVRFYRVSFRALVRARPGRGGAGVRPGRAAPPAPAPGPEAPRIDAGRAGARARPGRAGTTRAPPPPCRRRRPPVPAAADDDGAHTAPADEIKHVVEDLLATSPGGVTLDAVGNALKARGFRRTSGSPRLITRLRRLKGLEVTPRGIVRLVETARPEAPPDAGVRDEVAEGEAWVEAVPSFIGEPPAAEESDEPALAEEVGREPDSASPDEGAPAAAAADAPRAPAPWRRRRRRGGRRWRGRGPAGAPVAVGEPPRDAS